jgi:hypothetical protein
MSKPKYDPANALPEVELDSAGFAHGLHLLLLAIARTNPAVGALLDEFTSMHAEYLAELQSLAREDERYLPVLEKFTRSARLNNPRLTKIAPEQWPALRDHQHHPLASALLH